MGWFGAAEAMMTRPLMVSLQRPKCSKTTWVPQKHCLVLGDGSLLLHSPLKPHSPWSSQQGSQGGEGMNTGYNTQQRYI